MKTEILKYSVAYPQNRLR